jgi:hypothetical protein
VAWEFLGFEKHRSKQAVHECVVFSNTSFVVMSYHPNISNLPLRIFLAEISPDNSLWSTVFTTGLIFPGQWQTTACM